MAGEGELMPLLRGWSRLRFWGGNAVRGAAIGLTSL